MECILFIIFAFNVFGTEQLESNIEKLKTNPGVYLNSQDVPFFYNGNPLEGLTAFAVIPPYSIQNPEVNKKIGNIIEKELGVIGTIIRAEKGNLTGLATGNLINIQVGGISKWDGGELSISRVTLNVETQVVIAKTNLKSFPRVWSINDFVNCRLDIESEDKFLGAIQKLLKEFVRNYQFVNPTQKPTFYLY
jgi:hypothetical protein